MRNDEGGRSSTNQLVGLSPAIHNNKTRIKNANSEKVNELVSTLTVVLLNPTPGGVLENQDMLGGVWRSI